VSCLLRWPLARHASGEANSKMGKCTAVDLVAHTMVLGTVNGKRLEDRRASGAWATKNKKCLALIAHSPNPLRMSCLAAQRLIVFALLERKDGEFRVVGLHPQFTLGNVRQARSGPSRIVASELEKSRPSHSISKLHFFNGCRTRYESRFASFCGHFERTGDPSYQKME